MKLPYLKQQRNKNLKGAKSSRDDPAGKHTHFPRVTYFFISSLVKIWKIRVF